MKMKYLLVASFTFINIFALSIHKVEPSQSALSSYMESNKEMMTPPLPFSKASEIAAQSGSTNVAPTATKLINPEIAEPKLTVETSSVYPVNAEVPSFYGFKNEIVNATLYDKEKGRVIQEPVVVNKPIIKKEEAVFNINRKNTMTFNLRNGEEIKENKEKKLHGTEEPKKK